MQGCLLGVEFLSALSHLREHAARREGSSVDLLEPPHVTHDSVSTHRIDEPGESEVHHILHLCTMLGVNHVAYYISPSDGDWGGFQAKFGCEMCD